MNWTTEKTDAVKRLWRDGKSVSEIGREMGTSRGSIAGKLHRMGLLGNPPKDRFRKRKPVKAVPLVTPKGWDAKTFEPYEVRKQRIAAERMRDPVT